ncbi:hypothetical protein VTN31DRAFT_515 [Thermomyces dupontii]|uniref:uncharacterized protein n=1 Tax=Talaromyces thermophilus TaxID=28565 RepID=UPI003742933E
MEIHTITSEEWEHFSRNAWARSILTSATQDSNSEYVPIPTGPRQIKPDTGEDGFMGQTLNTATTLPFYITLRRRTLATADATMPRNPPRGVMEYQRTPFTPERPPDTITLVSLGSPGVSGYPSTAHGGLVATLFDECMSLAMALYEPGHNTSPQQESRNQESTSSLPDAVRGDRIYTAQLTVRYRQPVQVPALLVIRAWCVARNGRKTWTIAQAWQEVESDGKEPNRRTIRADASALWINADAPKL